MKNWLHFILSRDGRSYYQDENGNISQTIDRRPLKNTPDGWQDISVGYQRDLKKFGIVTSFTFPLKFVLDGLKILRKIYYTQFLAGELFYLITTRKVEITQDNKFKDYHTKWFRGEVDLVTFKDDEDEGTVTIGPTGIEKLVKQLEKTEYEFRLSDKDASIIELDGTNLYSRVEYEAPEMVEYDDSLYGTNHIIPFGIIAKEGDNSGVSLFDQIIETIPSGTQGAAAQYLNSSTNYFAANDVLAPACQLTLNGQLAVKITRRNAAINVRFIVRSNQGKYIELAYEPFYGILNQIVIFPVNISFLVNPGEHIFMTGLCYGFTGNNRFKYVFEQNSSVTVSFSNRYKSTYIKGFAPAVLLDKLVERICGRRNQTLSNLLSAGAESDNYLTCGDGIRSNPNGVVKISLEKFFSIYSVISFAGISIESEKVVMESISDFLNSSLAPISLGAVKSCKRYSINELMGNVIEIGHKSKDADGLNGKYRFNNIQKYSAPNQVVDKTITLVSDAIADPFVIENERIKFVDKKTTDSEKDNDLFIIGTSSATASHIVAMASKPAQSILPTGSKIKYVDFNNLGLVPNSDNSIFTWFGNPVLTDITSVINAISLPTTGQNVIASLYINDNLINSSTVVANGININYIFQNITLNTGDFIYVTLANSSGTSVSILSCSLSFDFINLSIRKLKRKSYSVLQGVPDETVFNVEGLTPARILEKWMPYLNSLNYRFDGKNYIFNTSDRNKELYTDDGSKIYDEDSDKPVTKSILFKPFVFEIETEIPIDLVENQSQNPRLPYEFEWLGNVYKGFLLKGGVAPDDNRSQVFTLLCTADTDETKFID